MLALAHLDEWIEGKLLRRHPFIPLAAIKEVKRPVWVDSTRAVKELGFAQSPIDTALGKAVDWFRKYRYV